MKGKLNAKAANMSPKRMKLNWENWEETHERDTPLSVSNRGSQNKDTPCHLYSQPDLTLWNTPLMTAWHSYTLFSQVHNKQLPRRQGHKINLTKSERIQNTQIMLTEYNKIHLGNSNKKTCGKCPNIWKSNSKEEISREIRKDFKLNQNVIKPKQCLEGNWSD